VQLAIHWPPEGGDPAGTTGENAVAGEKPAIYEKPVSPEDVASWLKEFGIARDLPPDSRSNENPFPSGYGDDLL